MGDSRSAAGGSSSVRRDVTHERRGEAPDDVRRLALQHQQSLMSNASRRTVTSCVSQQRRRSPVDHGYAWLIALASGVTFLIGAGFMKSYTMVYQQLLWRFGESATATAVVSSLHGGVKMCSSKYVT